MNKRGEVNIIFHLIFISELLTRIQAPMGCHMGSLDGAPSYHHPNIPFSMLSYDISCSKQCDGLKWWCASCPQKNWDSSDEWNLSHWLLKILKFIDLCESYLMSAKTTGKQYVVAKVRCLDIGSHTGTILLQCIWCGTRQWGILTIGMMRDCIPVQYGTDWYDKPWS